MVVVSPWAGASASFVDAAGGGVGDGLVSLLRPAYLATKAATSSASWPTTMFSGMIAPEKPPLRIA